MGMKTRSVVGVFGFAAATLLNGCASVPQLPPGPTVPVFVQTTRADANYLVTARGGAGELQSCHAPCTLQVTSGTVDVQATGDRNITARMILEPHPTAWQIREGNRGVRTAGGIISGLSSALILGGLIADGPRARESSGVGIGLTVVGSLGAITGLVMLLASGSDGVDAFFAGTNQAVVSGGM